MVVLDSVHRPARGGNVGRKIIVMVASLWIVGVAIASSAGANHEYFGQSGSHGTSGDNNFSGDATDEVWSGLAGDDGADGKGGGDRLCGDDDLDGTSAAPGDFLGGGGADKLDGGGRGIPSRVKTATTTCTDATGTMCCTEAEAATS